MFLIQPLPPCLFLYISQPPPTVSFKEGKGAWKYFEQCWRAGAGSWDPGLVEGAGARAEAGKRIKKNTPRSRAFLERARTSKNP